MFKPRPPRFSPKRWTVGFVACALALAGCSSKPVRVDREPATFLELESFLRTCRHAPVADVVERIRLRPRQPLSLGGHEVVQMLDTCRTPPCRQQVANTLGIYGNGEQTHAISPAFDPRNPEAAATYYASRLVEFLPPIRTFHLTVSDSEWISLGFARASPIWGLDPAILPAGADATGFGLRLRNRHLSFARFFAAVSPFFEVRMTDGSCPLPRAEQGNRCLQSRIPYEATDARLRKNYADYLDSLGTFEIDIPDRFYLDQNSRGYSYLVEYEDARGNLVPGSDLTRFTVDRNVLIDAFTDVPCEGWKIRRAALNAHNGGHPYAHFKDFRVHSDGRKEWYDRVTGTLDIRAIEYGARKNAARIYKRGAELIFNLCYSLQLEDPGSGSIGNVFKALPSATNPIGSIRGVEGICVNYSADADSDVVPPWLSPEHSDSPRYWRNPRLPGR